MQDNLINNNEVKNQESEKINENGKKGEKQTGEGKIGDIRLKILSVLTAVIIWFSVMWGNSPVSERTFMSVPVHHENLDVMERNSLSIIVDRATTIDVVVSGRRSAINRLRDSDIYAYIDFRDITSAGEHLLSINIRELDNVTVVRQSAANTMRYIDTTTTVNLRVNAEIRQSMTEQGVSLTPLNIKPDAIEVSGPKGVLETLSHAQVNLNLSSYGKIERSLTVMERIILMSEDGDEVNSPHIRADQTSVEVYISVETEKEVPIEVNFRHGFYTEKNTRVTVSPSVLRVRGSPDFLSNFDRILLPAIDEKRIEDVESVSLTMDIPLTEVRNMSGVTTAVVDIEFIDLDSKTISFDASNLKIIPPSGLEYNIREEMFQFKLIGPAINLNYVGQSGITATVDLSKIAEQGSRTVPVEVSVTSHNAVFCVGEYNVTVEIY